MIARRWALTGVVILSLATFWAWIDFGQFSLAVKAITQNGAFDLGAACAVVLMAIMIGISAILPKDGEK